MASIKEEYFPLGMPDCANLKNLHSGSSRYDYECTTSVTVRWPYTIVHLIIMAAIFLASSIVYTLYVRLNVRRLETKARHMMSSSSSFMNSLFVSKKMQQKISQSALERFNEPLISSLILSKAIMEDDPYTLCSEILDMVREISTLAHLLVPDLRETINEDIYEFGTFLTLRFHVPLELVTKFMSYVERALAEDPTLNKYDVSKARECCWSILNRLGNFASRMYPEEFRLKTSIKT